MLTDMFDVLYTPLDCEPPPAIDFEKLEAWISHLPFNGKQWFYSKLNYQLQGETYPWKYVTLYHNPSRPDLQGISLSPEGWLKDFHKVFPELVDYLYTAAPLPPEEFGNIILLPLRPEHSGFYWHRDDDASGLRMHLEHEDYENNHLFVRRSITRDRWPRPWLYDMTNPQHGFQEENLYCKNLARRQCFFINNVRALHSTVTNVPGKRRIALVFRDKVPPGLPHGPVPCRINELTSDLILRSAKKYKDHAVLWKAPKKAPKDQTL